MSVANSKRIKWQHIAGVSVICGLALTGCSRSDKNDDVEVEDTVTQPEVDNSAVAPAIACDDPLIQDRLKAALRNTLNQQAQGCAANYANSAQVSLDGGTVASKVNGIIIDVQNAAILQEANANGITTCQASISMTLPSEDLYQASQLQAANNLPSLQTRLAQENIRINNNMLVDDAFSYVVGAQDGSVRVRIAGQPAIVNVVADIVAGSAFSSVLQIEREQRAAQQAARRAANQNNNDNQTIRQPTVTRPTAPAQPAQPSSPPTINQDSNQNANQGSSAEAAPTTPKSVPKDDSIDMIIIEDESATY